MKSEKPLTLVMNMYVKYQKYSFNDSKVVIRKCNLSSNVLWWSRHVLAWTKLGDWNFTGKTTTLHSHPETQMPL